MSDEPIDLLSLSDDLYIDEEVRLQFSDIIKWGKFVAIATIVILSIFGVIVSVIIMDNPGASIRYGLIAANSFWLWIMVIIPTILEAILLYRFSILSQRAIAHNDIFLFNRALVSLKIFFIISGIAGVISCLFIFVAQIKS